MITREEILAELTYLPEEGSPATGYFKWNKTFAKSVTREWAGCVDRSKGYRRIRLFKRLYYEHRIVFFLAYGYWPKMIDHIDRNTLNNSLDNLRSATDGENLAHKLSRYNVTGYRGVYNAAHCNKRRPYAARISIDGHIYGLGYFDDPEQAARAFDNATKKAKGVFAVLNFPEE